MGSEMCIRDRAAGTKAALAIDAYLCRKEDRPVSPRPDPFGEGETPPTFPEGYSGPVWKP